MLSLHEALAETRSLLPPELALQLQPLFLLPEHRSRLATRLLVYQRQGAPASHPPPSFAGECTPPLTTAFEFFRPAIRHWFDFREDPSIPRRLADALTAAGVLHVLVLLGMRLTPASVIDQRGFPPPQEWLTRAAAETSEHGLSTAARALDKHAARNPAFWGTPLGNVEERNEQALEIVERILTEATWWNVFFHGKHEHVFEARLPSGHGARWLVEGPSFVGFLEPFDDVSDPDGP
jgi:hypothetical protein